MSSDQQNSQQLDPALYQYDQVYDQIKGTKPQPAKSSSKHPSDIREDRQRSRQKQHPQLKTGGSKYIKKMRQVVQQREKCHQHAHEKKMQKQNQRLGIKPQQVFVTQSYLKKKRQQKELQKKQKQKEKYDEEHSILNKNKNVHDFTRKLLEQRERKY